MIAYETTALWVEAGKRNESYSQLRIPCTTSCAKRLSGKLPSTAVNGVWASSSAFHRCSSG